MVSQWRELAAPVIAEVLEATRGEPEKEIRKALREAYPFGERSMWPYKVWLDEIRRQRGLPRLRSRGVKRDGSRRSFTDRPDQPLEHPGQGRLFE